jgi:hypothetical protein
MLGLKIKIEEARMFTLNNPMIIFRANPSKSIYNSIHIQIGSNIQVMMVINNTSIMLIILMMTIMTMKLTTCFSQIIRPTQPKIAKL